ncbi:uncharacterized protein BDZ83DRAFT_378553 [Colletotrichum acutatum]|uniref:Uncharacterized protein n=1 Tax=Glomerella acutata TaxID=27357 RepID=A0AAD9D1K4_GLOAC|nr:uncharacterized protein BDZ83DRAFT_378553 [Colletotrichum acutatum]KAK1730658.1 hypothetical protein BDZ83DRAFT_378553 [Colletotrichum acutatum]
MQFFFALGLSGSCSVAAGLVYRVDGGRAWKGNGNGGYAVCGMHNSSLPPFLPLSYAPGNGGRETVRPFWDCGLLAPRQRYTIEDFPIPSIGKLVKMGSAFGVPEPLSLIAVTSRGDEDGDAATAGREIGGVELTKALFISCSSHVWNLRGLHQPFLRSMLWGRGIGIFTGPVVRIVRSWGDHRVSLTGRLTESRAASGSSLQMAC